MKLILSMLALVAGTAQAGFLSGNELLERLNGRESNPTRYSHAQGYVVGVVDAHDSSAFCVPNNVNVGQLIDMTRQMLLEYPERRHDTTGATFVVAAMLRAFPCQGRQQERY